MNSEIASGEQRRQSTVAAKRTQIESRRQKLRLDFSARAGLLSVGGYMDDSSDLIERLCTAAAMVTEDEVEAALLHSTTKRLGGRIKAIAQAGQDIAALAEAAAVVARRWSDAGKSI